MNRTLQDQLTADVANFATGGVTVLVAQVDAADAAAVPATAAAER